jgi:hypothetical protein
MRPYLRRVTPLPERLFRRVVKTPECWLWTGSVNARGYGIIGRGRRNNSDGSKLAHRISYELAVGELAPDIDLHHRCGVKRCVNPQHLEPLTKSEHSLVDGGGRINKDKTHCRNGHPFAGDNLVIVRTKHGRTYRDCRACIRARECRTRERRKLAAA